MAEFQEVMRKWIRVRKATSSITDDDVLSVYPLNDYDDALIAAIEKNVMAWAAEHPEPEYSTWYEYLFNVTRGENKWPVDDHEFCQWLDTTRIPADIAQKLGIEPR